jgi:hypothetical protein
MECGRARGASPKRNKEENIKMTGWVFLLISIKTETTIPSEYGFSWIKINTLSYGRK